MEDNYSKALYSFSVNVDSFKKFLDFLNMEITMPNLPMKTLGGLMLWTTVSEVNGWKLQQNMFTKHARILNEHNVRVAWGNIKGMYNALDHFVEWHKSHQPLNGWQEIAYL